MELRDISFDVDEIRRWHGEIELAVLKGTTDAEIKDLVYSWIARKGCRNAAGDPEEDYRDCFQLDHIATSHGITSIRIVEGILPGDETGMSLLTRRRHR